MGKVILWLVIVFAVLFGLRLVNAARAKRRAGEAQQRNAPKTAAGEAMVRCARCGVYLPRAEATPVPEGFRCGDAKCLQQR
jgi:uncharacterized protein